MNFSERIENLIREINEREEETFRGECKQDFYNEERPFEYRGVVLEAWEFEIIEKHGLEDKLNKEKRYYVKTYIDEEDCTTYILFKIILEAARHRNEKG